MMRYYELWDMRSRNMLGSFGTEWEALALVRDLQSASASVDDLSLVWADEDDDNLGGVMAEGATLIARAQASAPSSA